MCFDAQTVPANTQYAYPSPALQACFDEWRLTDAQTFMDESNATPAQIDNVLRHLATSTHQLNIESDALLAILVELYCIAVSELADITHDERLMVRHRILELDMARCRVVHGASVFLPFITVSEQ